MIDKETAATTGSVPTCSYVWTSDFSIEAVPCTDEELRERGH